MVPTTTVDRSRIRTGYERVISNMVGRDFAGIAEENGEVTAIDTKARLVEVTYKSGKIDVFKFGEYYNEFQGFHVTQDIECIVKVGQKVEKGDVITYNKGFFNVDPVTKQLDFSIGILANVALMETDVTAEDSTEISQSLSKKLSIKPTNTRIITIPKRSVIHYAASVGDHIKNTDNLMIFEEEAMEGSGTITNDEETLALLSKLNRKTPTAKFSGQIVDIEVHYGCNLSDMHPSLLSIVKPIVDRKNKTNRMANKTERAEDFPPSTIMPKGSKYKGVTYDEDTVCLIYYIQETLTADRGDKLVFMNQLKCTCASVFTQPITSESGVPIDALFSCAAVGDRIVLSPQYFGITSRIMEKVENNILDMYFEEK